MKGHTSLGDFIAQVKGELVAAQDSSGSPFFQLDTVDLEVSFALEATGGAKGKLVVVELGGEAKASQTHKVTLRLSPTQPVSKQDSMASRGTGPQRSGGGGGGLRTHNKPVYAPNK